MYNMDKIAKDVGDIQSRLLHHRPIVNAEIRYFVREFECRDLNTHMVSGAKLGPSDEDCLQRISTVCVHLLNCLREKRGHRESRLLESLNKMVVEANDQMQHTNLEAVNQDLMSNLTKRLEAAKHMADRVQQRELEAQLSNQMQLNMERLKEEWADFLKEQQRLKEEVDEEHAKAVGQLSTHYSEKKMDLAKFSPL